MTHIPLYTVSGDAEARGCAYGELLRDRIKATFALYWERVFRASPLGEKEIRARADGIGGAVSGYSPSLAAELRGIAAGAGLEPWQIFALNGRTEILNAAAPECTTFYFADRAVLGQTWDWLKELEDLVVLLKCEYPNGKTLLTLTEPGMLAKIGMNSRGLGVGLNILVASHGQGGVPVHVLARALLECGTLAEARAAIARAGLGKSSHLLIGDAQGRAVGVEFAGDERAEIVPQDGVILHTNHCLAPGMESAVIPSSAERLEQGRAWLARRPGRNIEDMREMLSDGSLGPLGILASYRPEAVLGGAEVGTCATLLMDLPERTLHVRKGPDPQTPFEVHHLGAG